MLRAPQIPEQELLPKSDTSFVMSALGWQVTFTRDASGRATALTVSRGTGAAIEGKRTNQLFPQPAPIASTVEAAAA